MIQHRMLRPARLAIACFGVALFAACSDSDTDAPAPAATPSPPAAASTSPPNAAPVPASPNGAESAPPSGDATAELDRSALGVFEGTLPCADCSGILTELTLFLEPDTFSLKETHLGSKDGDKTLTSEGKWAMLTGSVTDPNATIVQLDPDKPDSARSFLEVGGDRLELLDRNQNRIESKLNYSLKRKADEEEGE